MTAKQTILIVDDNLTNILLLNNLLKDSYHIQTATTGAECIKIANAAEQPDLILLDIMMPNMDGYEVCIALKSNIKTQFIPVIFVTAKREEIDEEYGLKIGAVDYITKPINPLIVAARIKTQLELKQQNDRLIKSESLLKAILDNSPLLISTKDLSGNITTTNQQFEGFMNFFAGQYAGHWNTSGIYNTAVGSYALNANTEGIENSAGGSQALFHNTTGHYNTAMGYQAGFNNTTGSSNVFLGHRTPVRI